MATTGLSNPTIAAYSAESVEHYSDWAECGHAVRYSLSAEFSDVDPLYGDNIIIEQAQQAFIRGELELETSELTPDVNQLLLGLNSETVTYHAGEPDEFSITVYAYDYDTNPGLFGVGVVRQEIVDGEEKYVGVIFPKCRAQFIDDQAVTHGDQIEWRTPTLKFHVQRNNGGTWLEKSGLLDTEVQASAWIADYFGSAQSNVVGIGRVGFMILQ